MIGRLVNYTFTIFPLVNGYDENTDACAGEKMLFPQNTNNDRPVYHKKRLNFFSALWKRLRNVMS